MDLEKLLSSYYENYDEDGRLTSPHGSIEFLTTIRYIERYLRPGMRILEIGAGTGRYSHHFARQGYAVDAVELVEHNIEIFKENTQPDESITIRQGNALDLSDFADNTYDITLLLGPMYHLFTAGEQLQTLEEALRVTKSGGIVFVAYCMADACIVQYGFLRGMLPELIEKKLYDPQTGEASSDPTELFELHTREKIENLTNDLSCTRLHFVGTDMYTNYFRPQIDSMDKTLFGHYVNYHFSICERPDLVGLSNHVLDVLKKTNE